MQLECQKICIRKQERAAGPVSKQQTEESPTQRAYDITFYSRCYYPTSSVHNKMLIFEYRSFNPDRVIPLDNTGLTKKKKKNYSLSNNLYTVYIFLYLYVVFGT